MNARFFKVIWASVVDEENSLKNALCDSVR